MFLKANPVTDVCRDSLSGWFPTLFLVNSGMMVSSELPFRGETSSPVLAQVLVLPWHKRRKAAVAVAVTATAAAIAVMMRSTLEWGGPGRVTKSLSERVKDQQILDSAKQNRGKRAKAFIEYINILYYGFIMKDEGSNFPQTFFCVFVDGNPDFDLSVL